VVHRALQVQVLPAVPVSAVSKGLRRGAEGQPQLHAAEILQYASRLRLPKVRACVRGEGACVHLCMWARVHEFAPVCVRACMCAHMIACLCRNGCLCVRARCAGVVCVRGGDDGGFVPPARVELCVWPGHRR
jgi:hypothetical protein